MKCRKQPPFKIPEEIQNTWEVILDLETWDKIKNVRKQTRSTYSWVVRACVFRLLYKFRQPVFRRAMENHSPQIANRTTGHRFQLCLYGDDEKILRLAAFELGSSVSALIRLALDLYLSHFFRKAASITKQILIDFFTKVITKFYNARNREKAKPEFILYGLQYYPEFDLLNLKIA